MGVEGRGGAPDMGSAPRDKLWIRPCRRFLFTQTQLDLDDLWRNIRYR